jgi:manganese oxidase
MSRHINRRSLLRSGAALTAGALASQTLPAHAATGQPKRGVPRAARTGEYLPVITPDVPKLPWEMVDGVKVFHLRPEPVRREFAPGWTFDVWGYNGSMPGPTIEVVEGDRVRIIVDNGLPEVTTVHWHGIELPNEMDGVEGVTQDPIPPGGRFVYEFTLVQNGTAFYHSHLPMQQMMGLIGLFIIHPRQPHTPSVDHDFGLITQGWHFLPTNTIPAVLISDANWATLNGRAGPATTPLIVRHGSRVRIRLSNLSMDHPPMHVHGHQFFVVGTESGRIPESNWIRRNTVIVGVGQSQDIEFVAERLGDWMFHCHLPHHMMNWSMTPMVGPAIRMSGMEGQKMFGMQMPAQSMPGMAMPAPRDPRAVPGFRQDMFMPDDEAVAKPETTGLRPGWSGGVMGMTTLVRVLPPDQYERIKALQQQASHAEMRGRREG